MEGMYIFLMIWDQDKYCLGAFLITLMYVWHF